MAMPFAGGIYADDGWNAALDWSPDRRQKIRALQRASTPGLGIIGPIEELFHRAFGERGTTEFEMETMGLRRELMDLTERVQAAIPTLGPAKALEANAALMTANRLVNTYPEMPPELASWTSQVNAVMKTLKKYLPFNWTPILIGAGVLGFGLLWWSSRSPSRSNPRRRRRNYSKWSRKLPGGRLKRGGLMGWKKSQKASTRHGHLRKVVKKDGYATAVRRLVALENLSRDPGTDKAAHADVKWLQRTYR